MQALDQKKFHRGWLTRPFSVILLLLGFALLAGCSTLGGSQLDIYESTKLNIKIPSLPGWEVLAEESSQQGSGYLTMNNDYSGVLVSRAPLTQLLPVQEEGASIEDNLNALIDLSQGTFTSTGPVEEQRRAGYRQATVPISMAQVADLAGESNGTLLLAIQEDEAVVAIFFCAVDQREKCEKDLASSVEGFIVLAP